MKKYGFRLLDTEPLFIFKTPSGGIVRVSMIKPDKSPRKNFICVGEVTEMIASIPIYGICGISYVQGDGKICTNNSPREYMDLLLEYETFRDTLEESYMRLLEEKLLEYDSFRKKYIIDLTTEYIDLT